MMKSVRTAALISSSPRRREILSRFVPSVKTIRPRAEEVEVSSPRDLMRNARLKFSSVKAGKADLLLAADTGVFLGSACLGKPSSPGEARATLRRLSGHWHTVVTAMVVRIGRARREATVSTRVRFRELSDEAIEAYVSTGEPMDKAGAYGIQGLGAVLVEDIAGDYYNVVGLPISRLEGLLEEAGYTLLRPRKAE